MKQKKKINKYKKHSFINSNNIRFSEVYIHLKGPLYPWVVRYSAAAAAAAAAAVVATAAAAVAVIAAALMSASRIKSDE